MKKLTKEQLDQKQRLEEALQEKEVALVQVIQALNEHLAEATGKIEALQDEYNQAVQDAEAFREQIASDQEAHLDNLSDRQRDSENGQAYSDWASSWESGFDEIQVDLPDAIDLPDLTALEALRDLTLAP